MKNISRFNMAGGIKRVTAGPGGESFLIPGKEKFALLDCGMAFCAPGLIENIKRELPEGRKLDYILLTHTHYDHIGGLPYLKREWPDAIAVGAPYAKEVFTKPGALEMIRQLSQTAATTYSKNDKYSTLQWNKFDLGLSYRDEDLKVDLVVREGDRIDLGDRVLTVIDTPGHTSCSISFLVEDEGIYFPAETTGCFVEDGEMIMAILKNYNQTIDSIEKGRKLNPKYIISPHYGQVPEEKKQDYWDSARKTSEKCRDIILELYQAGASAEEIYQKYKKTFWHSIDINQQPQEAFKTNAIIIINTIIREFSKLDKC